MKHALLLICILCLAAGAFCIQAPVKLTIVTESYPPLSFAQGDSITGYGAEVVKVLQKAVGNHDKITLMKWDDAYKLALKEPNVLIFTLERTPARDTLFSWIGPLGENKTYFYGLKKTGITLTNLDDAKKVKAIATTTNWFTEQLLKDKGFKNLVSSATPVENVKQLMKGKATLSIFTDLTVGQIVKDAGYTMDDIVPVYEVMTTGFYLGFSKKTDPATVKAWQKAFIDMRKSGQLMMLRKKCLY